MRRLGGLLAFVLLLSAWCGAQVELGDDLKLNLSGLLGASYGGAWSNYAGSSHSLGFNGSANLSGYYYRPQFLNFSIQPIYNRSQNNSATQSIFDSTSILGTASFFSGSKFPGWVSYNKTLNGSSQLGIPGLTGLETEGSAQSFAIGWSVLLPKWPTISASFATGSSSSTVLGTVGDSKTATKNFSLNSSYTLAGWALMGFFNHQTLSLSMPSVLGFSSDLSGSHGNTYGVSANHRLPLSGSFSAGWSRSTFGSDSTGRADGASNNLSAGASISPTNKLTISGDVRFISNILGDLQRTVLNGGNVILVPLDNSSHSLSFGGTATYAIGHGFAVRGYVSHRRQYYRDQDVSDTLYGAILTYHYSRPLLGLLHFSFGLVNTANEQGSNRLGFVSSVGVDRKFGRWDMSADISYSQNVQTLLVTYTTSSYTYGGHVRRRLTPNMYWNGSFRAAHSGLTQQEGEGNSSYSVTTGMTWRKYGATLGYSTSSGTTVVGANGLLTPVPEIGWLTNDLVLFNGRSYSVGVYASPVRKMTLTGSYTNASSETNANSVFSRNKTEMLTARLEYRLRQLSVIGGFTRYRQGISATGGLPSVVNSYSIGISRWFNVF